MTCCVTKHEKHYLCTSRPRKFYTTMLTEKFELYMSIYYIYNLYVICLGYFLSFCVIVCVTLSMFFIFKFF